MYLNTIEYGHALPQTYSLQSTRAPVARVMKFKFLNDKMVVQNFKFYHINYYDWSKLLRF